jgi:putative SOS response-associated peptidase YedK
MCGRYVIEISDAALREICEEVQRKAMSYPEQLAIKFDGDVFPSAIAPVQDAPGSYVPMQWGFTGFDGKLLINARSESALEKPTFRESMLERRCLVPASGYYEWRKAGTAKTKYRFSAPASATAPAAASAIASVSAPSALVAPAPAPNQPLYLAGCYRQEKGSSLCRFVILTRQATSELAVIHDRMPVIIPQAYAKDWLCESPDAMEHALVNLHFEVA